MKKISCALALVLAVALVFGLFSSSLSLQPTHTGVEPYPMSQWEMDLLEAFGMADSARIFRFHAPEEAISLAVHVYRLSPEGEWLEVDGGGISIGLDRKPVDRLDGTFTMQLREDYAIDFRLNCAGQAAYRSQPIALDREPVASIQTFLEERQEIHLDQETPVALMAYSAGTKIRSMSLSDFYEPQSFQDMALVQAVTLEFSAGEL